MTKVKATVVCLSRSNDVQVITRRVLTHAHWPTLVSQFDDLKISVSVARMASLVIGTGDLTQPSSIGRRSSLKKMSTYLIKAS